MPAKKKDQLYQVNIIRFVLPFVLFMIVAIYEVWEHWILDGVVRFNFHLTSEVAFFGVFGPTAVFIVLSYIVRLLENQIAVSTKLAILNRDLEKIVAERTDALESRNIELAKANEELQKLDQLKSDFVSLVSHELRGPLTTLNGGLEVALHNADQMLPESRRTLEVMAHESQRLTQFVQRILDVSRLEAGKLELNPGPVAVFPMLRRAVELVCECDNREVKLSVAEELPPVWADELALEKVVGNLLSNAAKYSPADKPIELSAALNDGEVVVTIIDYGSGIPVEMQGKIFDRFIRLERGDRISTQGWGLGLYFVKALTEAQGGQITVKSPVNEFHKHPGTAFTLAIPITAEVPKDV